MHYFTFNIGDYLKDTGGLSLIEHGAYMLLLNWAYANEKPLPLDEERLFRITSAVTKHDRKATFDVLAQFFQREDDGFHHKRVIKEIVKFYNRKEAGTANVGKRYQKATKDLPNDQQNEGNEADNHNARITKNAETKNHLLSANADEGLLELDPPEVSPSDSPTGSTVKKRKGGAARQRNPWLDALAVVGGGSLESVTGPMWGEAAKALATIREVCPGVTPEQITAAANAHRAEWPKASCSPSSIAKHWAKFGPQKKEGAAGGISDEPAWDWRAFALVALGYEIDLPWKSTMERMRKEIMEAWTSATADEQAKFMESEVAP